MIYVLFMAQSRGKDILVLPDLDWSGQGPSLLRLGCGWRLRVLDRWPWLRHHPTRRRSSDHNNYNNNHDGELLCCFIEGKLR